MSFINTYMPTQDIPNNTIGRYLFDSDGFHYQGSFVDMNMGNAETLENFLRYGKDVIEKDFFVLMNFPSFKTHIPFFILSSSTFFTA